MSRIVNLMQFCRTIYFQKCNFYSQKEFDWTIFPVNFTCNWLFELKCTNCFVCVSMSVGLVTFINKYLHKIVNISLLSNQFYFFRSHVVYQPQSLWWASGGSLQANFRNLIKGLPRIIVDACAAENSPVASCTNAGRLLPPAKRAKVMFSQVCVYHCVQWGEGVTPNASWDSSRVLTRTGKPGKMGRHFPVREFWPDWKSQGKSHKILENWGNFRQNYMLLFSDS